MATQQKWTQLFEQVVGRKPTAKEFIQGKQTGFDPKSIKAIAAVSDDSVAISEAPVAGSTATVSYQSPTFKGQEINAQEARWVDAFRQVVGREPSASEVQAARSTQFDLQEINLIAGGVLKSSTPASFVQAQPQLPTKKKKGRRQKRKEQQLAQEAQAQGASHPTTPQAVKPSKKKASGNFIVTAVALLLAFLALGVSIYQTSALSQARQELKEVKTLQDNQDKINVFSNFFLSTYVSSNKVDYLSLYLDGDIQKDVHQVIVKSYAGSTLEKIRQDKNGFAVVYVVSYQAENGTWKKDRVSFSVKEDAKSNFGYVVTTVPKHSNY
ncbi:hypothetical protein [Streptococcus sp. DD12]|uniref:hypothetical protein n=1 Tax=Streptococcus sp. DD12 TaxID=1777880 RepID=UPI0007997301|nr:hypothetical protein [Streptococcus sp. DD12]KXT75957.1 hypothetical protein STRDD12_01069 [Streptococcus sp. DD12]